MTVRFSTTLTKRCHPAFTAALMPLLMSHSAEPPSERSASKEPTSDVAVNAATQPLDSFAKLWDRSMFTTHATQPPPEPVAEAPPDWAADFELSGWTRVDGRLTVFLTRLSSGSTLELQENETETPDTPQLLALDGEDTILDGRVQLSINGVTAWVSLNPAASTNPAIQVSAPEPTAAAGTRPTQEAVVPPTTIDSRAARLNGPVLLDANATYESIITPEQDSAPAVERLRVRREKLIRDFPRRSAP
jgi:hypothetical protein